MQLYDSLIAVAHLVSCKFISVMFVSFHKENNEKPRLNLSNVLKINNRDLRMT